MSCTETGPFVGGVYSDASIINSTITGGEASSMKLTNTTLEGSVKVDSSVATQLMQAIQEQTPVMVTNKPASSTEDNLPTTIIGEDRSQLLGKPAGFIKIGAYMVPVYRAE